jgi:hypothetical protein
MNFTERQRAIAVEHYTKYAMTPGYWGYTREKLAEMEADKEAQGLWRGIRARVGARIAAAGFKPDPAEDYHPADPCKWWVIPNKF